ncbi:hypothetical protein FRB90_009769 [Tulasnella sp. 427]|nr:hypothetical protein FRB90_009769 [Tulasnella sp. 427]
MDVPSLRQAGCECLLDESALELKGIRLKREITQQSDREGAYLRLKVAKEHRSHVPPPAERLAGDAEDARHFTKAPMPALLQDAVKGTGKKSGRGAKGKMKADANASVALDRGVRGESFGMEMLPSGSVSPDHPLLAVRIKESTSPKINFIVKEMVRCPEDRFIIFSESPGSLLYVKEALDACRIRSLMVWDRKELGVLQQFETDMEQRAILLELKHGARGLNLTSANRVIFIEPVWQPDVESQAIKRAHRIGQRRAVTVQTLVMKGTAEEEMLSRRAKYGRTHKLMQNDVVMRDFVANPRFIDPTFLASDDANTVVDVPLFEVERALEAVASTETASAPTTTTPKRKVEWEDEVGDSSQPKKKAALSVNEERRLPRVRLVLPGEDAVMAEATSSGATEKKKKKKKAPSPGVIVFRI